MFKQKWIALLLALAMIFALASCSGSAGGKGDAVEQAADAAETAVDDLDKEIQDLIDQENAIMEDNKDLWDKLLDSMDKTAVEGNLEANMTYPDILLAQLEANAETFTEEETAKLKDDIEKIRAIEEKLLPLQEEYEGNTADPGEGETAADTSATSFPAFEGKDLDGNAVDSSLFSNNAVTVVNFWFSDCVACVGELGDLNALNDKLKEKGCELIGINADTLGGYEDQIAQAKKLLESKGAVYSNIYFDSTSEAGKLTESIQAFPVTMLVDRSGNIVGEPFSGAMGKSFTEDELMAQVDAIIAAEQNN